MSHLRKLTQAGCIVCGSYFIGIDFGGGNIHKTCSRSCLKKRQSQAARLRCGPKSGTWKGGKPEWICGHCGGKFRAYHRKGGEPRKYCSWDCSNTANGRLGADGTPGTADDMRTRVRYERVLAEFLEERGYQCLRSAGSRGPADLFAINENFFRCIQVKTTKAFDRRGNTTIWCNAIQELLTLPVPSNSTLELWVYVLRGKWRYAVVNDAPVERKALREYVRNIEWVYPE